MQDLSTWELFEDGIWIVIKNGLIPVNFKIEEIGLRMQTKNRFITLYGMKTQPNYLTRVVLVNSEFSGKHMESLYRGIDGMRWYRQIHVFSAGPDKNNVYHILDDIIDKLPLSVRTAELADAQQAFLAMIVEITRESVSKYFKDNPIRYQ